MLYNLNYRLLCGSLAVALSLGATSGLIFNPHVIAAMPDTPSHITTFELIYPDQTSWTNTGDKSIAQANYGKLPTSFIANAGQVDPAVRFEVRSSAGSLFFTPGGVTLSVPTELDQSDVKSAVAVRLNFAGANANPVINGTDPLPGTANFFIGSDPAQWHTHVKTYAGITYRNLYSGIDLSYIGHAGTLKGTYTLAAGVDPGLIRWNYAGADSMAVDTRTGDLHISAAGVVLTEQVPQAWQIRSDGTQIAVAARYQLDSIGTAQFIMGDYDRTQPLIIDPGLVYSTYLGGSGADIANGIAVGADGSAYVAGNTTSTNFPGTNGAYQPGKSSGWDVFVSRLNPAGNGVIFSTYLGGSSDDYGYAVAVDNAGDAYVTGETRSTNFPITSGVFQSVSSGDAAFITKVHPDGTALSYSTYLGGGNHMAGIAVDSNQNAYVVGTTGDPNFPVFHAFQPTVVGGYDATVTKLNAAGSGLVYSTFLGGNLYTNGFGITVNGAGNAFVTGKTVSTNFPVTFGAYQPISGGSTDAFVTEFSTAGNTVVYSTYLGGSGADDGYAVTVDSGGNAYVTGDTTSTNFPVTSGAFQTVNGPQDAFVTKLNPTGTALIYSTFLGGTSGGNTLGAGIAVNTAGEAIVTGTTSQTNFPVTAGAFQTTLRGSQDVFITKLNALGSGLLLSTYFGGDNLEFGYGIALDSNGDTYITGYTQSVNFPTYQPFQAAIGGGGDAFVTKFGTQDGRIDSIGIYRAGVFYLRLHNTQGFADFTVGFNPAGNNFPVVGDWLGNGYDAIGVYDRSSGNFTLCNQNSTANCGLGANLVAFTLGNPNDTPLAGRWSVAATHAGAGVFRPSNGVLYLKSALTTGFADNAMVLGLPGDAGVAGDWNGKGFDSPGIYRPGNIGFFLSNQVTSGPVFADITLTYGSSSDLPIAGDWIAQGNDGVGMFRPANGFVYLRNALTTGFANNSFFYGTAGDIPVAGHWQVIYPPAAPPQQAVTPSVLITKTPDAPSNNGNSVPGDNWIGG